MEEVQMEEAQMEEAQMKEVQMEVVKWRWWTITDLIFITTVVQLGRVIILRRAPNHD